MTTCEMAPTCQNRKRPPMSRDLLQLIFQMVIYLSLFLGGIWAGVSVHAGFANHRCAKIATERDLWKKMYETLHQDVVNIQAHFDESDQTFRCDLKASLDRIETNTRGSHAH